MSTTDEKATQTPAQAQISFTALLVPGVSTQQFQDLQKAITVGLETYNHLIQSYTNNDIPPSAFMYPMQATFQGVDPVATRQAIFDACHAALSVIPGFVSLTVDEPK